MGKQGPSKDSQQHRVGFEFGPQGVQVSVDQVKIQLSFEDSRRVALQWHMWLMQQLLLGDKRSPLLMP